MLEHFYESSWHLSRLRQAPFSESIDALASRLHQLGYPRRYSLDSTFGHVGFLVLAGQAIPRESKPLEIEAESNG